MIGDTKEHLNLTNETYIQHFKFATCVGISMIYGGIQAIIHAIYPGILTKAASTKIRKLFTTKRTDKNALHSPNKCSMEDKLFFRSDSIMINQIIKTLEIRYLQIADLS